HNRLHPLVRNHDLELDLGQEIDRILGAAVKLGVSLLAAEALDFGHGGSVHTGFRERLAYIVETKGLDDGGDHFHEIVLRCDQTTSRDSTTRWRNAGSACQETEQ